MTADRPAWDTLPADLRAAISSRLGGPVVSVRMARSGFTRGFAGVVTAGSGARAFVKASPIDYLVAAYRREALVTAALPDGVPAARPRWTLDVANWYALGLDVIDGRLPVLPWRPSELRATLDAWAVAASALALPPSALALAALTPSALAPSAPSALALAAGFGEMPIFADLVRSEVVLWQEIAAHRAPLPSMPRYALPHLDELASLEARLAGYAAASTGLMHCDLRLDNILIAPDGTAWLCDWNHVCRGPAWFDTASLLVTAYASGLDADELFATHPTVTGLVSGTSEPGAVDALDVATAAASGAAATAAPAASGAAPADALDVALAALAGLWLGRAGRPSDASPSIAAHQRWSGQIALGWLADRRGWARDAP